jgi:DNA gyrase subunit B
MIYRLMPTLIKEGKVFIAESPLFEINCKNKTYFAYNEREKNEIISKLDGKYTIQRSKGLGENEPEMMWQTTMNPETRRLIKVVMEDVERTNYYFEMLLGDNLDERKRHIEENGHLFLDHLDLM